MSVQSSNFRSKLISAMFFSFAAGIAGGMLITALPQQPPAATELKTERSVEVDRQMFLDFGIARHSLTAESAAELPDLYSSSLTADSSYSWDNPDYVFRLNTDRILPLSQLMKLGVDDWPASKKESFGADPANLSPTSHAANSWKGLKTPRDMLVAQELGSFSWTDKCADVYKDLVVLTPVGGCEGVPEDFDSCGYAERYKEIAARYELKIPQEDQDALSSLSAKCPKD